MIDALVAQPSKLHSINNQIGLNKLPHQAKNLEQNKSFMVYQELTKTQQRYLALSAVIYASLLVDRLANTGSLLPKDLELACQSILITSPENTLEVFGTVENILPGLEKVRLMLSKQSVKPESNILRMTVGILHLQKMISRREDMLNVLSTRITQARKQADHFDAKHENVISNLAETYQETFSKLSYRIQVYGDPTYLQQQHIAQRVRVLLLFGIRSATLWRQLGGSRWQFFFST